MAAEFGTNSIMKLTGGRYTQSVQETVDKKPWLITINDAATTRNKSFRTAEKAARYLDNILRSSDGDEDIRGGTWLGLRRGNSISISTIINGSLVWFHVENAKKLVPYLKKLGYDVSWGKVFTPGVKR